MRFSSRDVSRVESTWKDYVPSAVLQKVDPQRFRFDWHSVELAGVSVVRYALDAEIQSLVEPQDQLLVCRVDGPDAAVWSRRANLDPTEPWLTDGAQVGAQWQADTEVRALIFDRSTVNAFARQLTGDDSVRVRARDLRPNGRAAAARWERMFDYVERSLADEGDTDDVLSAELTRHALSVTLASFATTADDRLLRPAQTTPAPDAVRRALAFMSENAHRAITVDDVAAAVHMSTQACSTHSADLSTPRPQSHCVGLGSTGPIRTCGRRVGIRWPRSPAAGASPTPRASRRPTGRPMGCTRRRHVARDDDISRTIISCRPRVASVTPTTPVNRS